MFDKIQSPRGSCGPGWLSLCLLMLINGWKEDQSKQLRILFIYLTYFIASRGYSLSPLSFTHSLLDSNILVPFPTHHRCIEYYELKAQITEFDFGFRSPEGKPLRSQMLTYDGEFPGPRIVATQGVQALVRLHNHLHCNTTSWKPINKSCSYYEVDREREEKGRIG